MIRIDRIGLWTALVIVLALTGCPTPEADDDATADDDDATDDDDDTGIPPDPDEICDRPVDLADTSSADQVVGDGSAASCTEAALATALAAGGTIVFDCGPDPVTIPLTTEQFVTHDTVLDGGGMITLDGGGQTRILNMDTGNFEATSPLLTAQRLTFANGRASGTPFDLGTYWDGGGGAIFYLGGSVTAIDCTFVDNEAAEIGPDVGGGAIYGAGVGETTIVGCVFQGNRGSNGGAVGALHTGLTIVNSTLAASVATGYGANYQDENNVQQGHGGNGGAICMDGSGRTLYICGTTVTGSRGGAIGGALFRTGYEEEPSIIDRSTFSDNEIPELDPSDPDNRSSGVLYIIGTQVTLTDSTISGNIASGYAGVWISSHGAAPGLANLTNVTITGNATHPQEEFTERGIGAGVIIGSDTTGTLQNCTIAGNVAQFASGVINVSPLTVNNCIIANDYENEWTPLNCTGTNFDTPPASGHDNLQWPGDTEWDMDCVEGIVRAEPMLGELADNGGPTLTMAPLPGSPAIGGGTDCPATDQRGEPRSEPCTIGAYEVAE